jgi:hypothetical protein
MGRSFFAWKENESTLYEFVHQDIIYGETNTTMPANSSFISATNMVSLSFIQCGLHFESFSQLSRHLIQRFLSLLDKRMESSVGMDHAFFISIDDIYTAFT